MANIDLDSDIQTADLVTASMDAWYALGEVSDTVSDCIKAKQPFIRTVILHVVLNIVKCLQVVMSALADTAHREDWQAGWASLTPEQQSELSEHVQKLLTLKRG